MRSRHSPETVPVGPARWVALLAWALALWASQTLAILHGVAYDEQGHLHHGELFGHHDDDPAQCHLIDQLAHDAPLPALPRLVAHDFDAPIPWGEPRSQPIDAAAVAAPARAPPYRA
jgi:hypothetical protein